MKIEFENNRPPYVFRYRQNNDNTLLEIENNNIFFPNNEKLNDPFDANHQMINIPKEETELEKFFNLLLGQFQDQISREYFKKMFENNPIKLYDYVNQNMKAFCSTFGIACFTFSPVNIMLWASYANNHQGICIQYNTDIDKEFFKSLRPMEYVDLFQKIDYLPATNPGEYQELFYKKLAIWKNEFELRLIKSKTGLHILNPLAIRAIAFGLRSSDEYKNKIIKIVEEKHKHIKLYETSILSDTYGLQFTEMLIKKS